MRSGLVWKMLIASGVTIVLGLVALNMVAHVFSNRINEMTEAGMRELSDTLNHDTATVYQRMENDLLATIVADQEERARHQVAAAAIYAMQPLQYGEIAIFQQISAQFIEGGDYVALYAVYPDGSFFSGASRNSSPEVTSRIGEDAGQLRVDKVAERLMDPSISGVTQFTAPIIDLAGVTRGEVRLLVVDDSVKQHRADMDAISAEIRQNIEASVEGRTRETLLAVHQASNGFRRGLWVAGLGTLALACVALFVTTRFIARPLVAAARMANAIRAGDLSARVHSDDSGEVGMLILALNDMADKVRDRDSAARTALHRLGRVLEHVALAANEITASAGYLSNASQELTNDADRQQRLMHTIGSSIGELEGGIKLSTRNADKTAELSTQALDAAKKGDREMERMTRAMTDLQASQGKVASAMKVIDEIAFQTNLLALNASVEAARAGKHGRGFAVVAGEVRNLAAKSAKAARQTEQLMQESLDRLSYTTDCLASTNTALAEIENVVEEVGGLMTEIARVAGENFQGISAVKESVQEVGLAAERTAQSASASAATAEELLAMAGGLKDILRLNRNGDNKARAAIPLTDADPAPAPQF
ncbi:MAG: methyl-accepting chemotaxis protein [Planctomycetaceae bacterium]|nr:methyl-accepting chemotaxis protein [Planctomycetaceae bacterium]